MHVTLVSGRSEKHKHGDRGGGKVGRVGGWERGDGGG